MLRIALGLLALLGMLDAATAEPILHWDRKTVEAPLVSGEKTVRAEFDFVNVSQAPAVIDSVKSSCGCTTAGLEKKIYQPGEHGKIIAIFTPGSRKGNQVKGIRVKVKGEDEPVTLALVAHIGPSLQIDPPLVFWRTGEPPRPKTMRVTVPSGLGLRVTGVTSSDPQMAAALEPEKEGYRMTVTPKATAHPATAVLTLQALTRTGEEQVFQAYAQVK
jgi:hypothetical protein